MLRAKKSASIVTAWLNGETLRATNRSTCLTSQTPRESHKISSPLSSSHFSSEFERSLGMEHHGVSKVTPSSTPMTLAFIIFVCIHNIHSHKNQILSNHRQERFPLGAQIPFPNDQKQYESNKATGYDALLHPLAFLC
jgi:hypothetical protein